VAGSNGIGKGDISSSRTTLVMPPGEKAALFYHRLDEVCGVVAELLKDSVRQGEMCRFMFRVPKEVMKERMKAHGLDLDSQPSIEIISLSQALADGYSGSSIGEQMWAFVQKAKTSGYAGTRLILNMPEVMAAQEPEKSGWSELEEVLEELGVTLVCLYDMASLSPGFLLRSLASYPQVIIDGVLCRNFYYVPSLNFPQRDASRDLYEQLEVIREERDIRQNEGRERSKLMESNLELQNEMMQRRMAEFALLRAENNLRTMLDAMSDSVFMIDRDMRVTIANNTFVRYLGEMRLDTSYEGKPIYELFPGLPVGGRRLFEEVFRYGYSTVVEESLDYQGVRREMEVRMVPVMMGDKVDRIVVISRQKTVSPDDLEAMWARAEAMKDEILNPSGPSAGAMELCPHAIMVTDPEWNLISVNQAMAREFGRSKEEVLGIGNSLRFLHARRNDEGQVRRIDVNGRISAPSVMTRSDGSVLDVMCYVTFVEGDDRHRALTIIRPEP